MVRGDNPFPMSPPVLPVTIKSNRNPLKQLLFQLMHIHLFYFEVMAYTSGLTHTV